MQKECLRQGHRPMEVGARWNSLRFFLAEISQAEGRGAALSTAVGLRFEERFALGWRQENQRSEGGDRKGETEGRETMDDRFAWMRDGLACSPTLCADWRIILSVAWRFRQRVWLVLRCAKGWVSWLDGAPYRQLQGFMLQVFLESNMSSFLTYDAPSIFGNNLAQRWLPFKFATTTFW
jgi:hypothetical protein